MATLKQTINKLLSPRTNEHEQDKTIVITVGIIIVFGLIMLSSATSAVAYYEHQDSYYFLKHQFFGLGVGLLAFYFFSKVDYHRWGKYAFWFLVVSVILLLLVFIPGLSAHYGKARSWINIFGFSLDRKSVV